MKKITEEKTDKIIFVLMSLMREKEATDSSSHGRLLFLKVEETALRTQGAEMERVVFKLFGGNSK